MYKELIDHKIKKFFRSPTLTQDVVSGLVIGLSGFGFLIFGLIISSFLGGIIASYTGNSEDLGRQLSQFLVYYFLFDWAARYLFQGMSTVEISHYVLLNVPKKKLIRFLLFSSVFNFFTAMGIVLILPFYSRHILSEHSLLQSTSWLMGILSILLFNHYWMVYLKRRMYAGIGPTVGVVGIVIALIAGDYLGWISLTEVSELAFGHLLDNPFSFLIFAFAVWVMYRVNFQFLLNNFRENGNSIKRSSINNLKGWSMLENLEKSGLIGTLIAQEIKLALRNKRPRQLLASSVLFGILGLAGIVFLLSEGRNGEVSASLWIVPVYSMIIVGVFIFTYGKYLTSWESSFFEGLMVQNIRIRDYYLAKWILVNGSCILVFLMLLPVAFYFAVPLLLLTMGLFYNIGINSFIALLLGAFNNKPIDLTKSNIFNNQGESTGTFLFVMVSVIIFMIFFGVFSRIYGFDKSQWILVGVSLLSLALYKIWFRLILKMHRKRKYNKLDSFRKKG